MNVELALRTSMTAVSYLLITRLHVYCLGCDSWANMACCCIDLPVKSQLDCLWFLCSLIRKDFLRVRYQPKLMIR